MNENRAKPELFFFRRPDGKFYRGAKLWMWTRSWRRAAVFTKLEWEFLRTYYYVLPEDGELLTLTEVAK
jgi:hypothetical protein